MIFSIRILTTQKIVIYYLTIYDNKYCYYSINVNHLDCKVKVCDLNSLYRRMWREIGGKCTLILSSYFPLCVFFSFSKLNNWPGIDSD